MKILGKMSLKTRTIFKELPEQFTKKKLGYFTKNHWDILHENTRKIYSKKYHEHTGTYDTRNQYKCYENGLLASYNNILLTLTPGQLLFLIFQSKPGLKKWLGFHEKSYPWLREKMKILSRARKRKTYPGLTSNRQAEEVSINCHSLEEMKKQLYLNQRIGMWIEMWLHFRK